MQLPQDFSHVLVGRHRVGLFQRLQQLRENFRLAETGLERLQPLPELRVERHHPLRHGAELAQESGHGTKLAPVEQVGKERFEDVQDLFAHDRGGLQLENIEQGLERGPALVPGVLRIHFLLEPRGFLLVQEIER